MPTLPQGRFCVLCCSLILSCAVFGVSIDLLRARKPGEYMNMGNSAVTVDWGPQPQQWRRDRDLGGPRPLNDAVGFHNVMILSTASSAFNMLLSAILLAASSMKRKTVISAVAFEAPCIYAASFMWLVTGAYAEHRVELGGSFSFLDAPECIRYKVLEGVAFINWIQLMLYANTLMTVAIICHVRRRNMWLHPVSELPSFAAPALTFAPKLDVEYDSSSSRTKTNESEVPILGVSNQPVDFRPPSHFRSRLPFFPHPSGRIGSPSADPLQRRPSVSAASLAPTVSTNSDDPPSPSSAGHSRSSTGHSADPTGEPPTYYGPGSTYKLVAT